MTRWAGKKSSAVFASEKRQSATSARWKLRTPLSEGPSLGPVVTRYFFVRISVALDYV